MHGIPRFCTHYLGNNKTNNFSDRWKICHPFPPNKSNSTSAAECKWLCVTIQLQNSTHRWFSQHCSWFFLQAGTQSHGEYTSQNPGRSSNNTDWSYNIFLGCLWWRTILIHSMRQLKWVTRTNSQTVHKLLNEAIGIMGKLNPQILVSIRNFVQCGHYACPRKKDLLINRTKLRIIWCHVINPLFHEWQRRSLLDILQQAVNKTCQISKKLVPNIFCYGLVNKILGNWNRTTLYRDGNITTNTHGLLWRKKDQQKRDVEPPWNNTSVFLRNHVQFFGNHYVHMKDSEQDNMEILTELKKEMKQKKLHEHQLVQIEVPVHLFFSTSHIQ